MSKYLSFLQFGPQICTYFIDRKFRRKNFRWYKLSQMAKVQIVFAQRITYENGWPKKLPLKVPGEKGLWRRIWIFWFVLEGSLLFDNLQHSWAFQTLKNQNFLQPCWNNAQITILTTLSHHNLMFWNPTKIYGVVGWSQFWRSLRRDHFGEASKIIAFAWGRFDPWWHYVCNSACYLSSLSSSYLTKRCVFSCE